MDAIVYGETPAGYKSDAPAPPLKAGEYTVLVVSEQGQGMATFRVGTAA